MSTATAPGNQPPPALTTLDRRAIRSAWLPVFAVAFVIGAGVADTAILVLIGRVGGVAPLVCVAVTIVMAVALTVMVPICRTQARMRILRADVIAAHLTSVAEYRQWVAMLPDPSRVWCWLGAPPVTTRLQLLATLPAVQAV
jgi:hypothetical protein